MTRQHDHVDTVSTETLLPVKQDNDNESSTWTCRHTVPELRGEQFMYTGIQQ